MDGMHLPLEANGISERCWGHWSSWCKEEVEGAGSGACAVKHGESWWVNGRQETKGMFEDF
jgi:hypothetical protein